MNTFYIKTNRIFTPLRNWAWLFILLVAFGGLWYPKFGLLMIPIMIALPVIGFQKGKYWCGNICPHGSLFDRFILKISANKKIPSWAKSKITVTIGLAWFMYMLGKRLIKVFAIWGTTPFIDKLGFVFVMNYLVVTIVGTILALLISPRTWCNFCPMGTFQIIFYKLGKLLGLNKKTDEKITVASTEMCHTCGKCARVCPMQLNPYLEFNEKNQIDNEACIRCSTCVENCPASILTLNNEENAIKLKDETILDGYENIRIFISRINNIKDLGNEVKEFTFKIEKGTKIDYKPGQFILVKIQDEPQMYRAYSISYYNEKENEIFVTIKKAPNGYGTNIIFNNFKVGDTVELKGPMGKELVVDKTAEKVLFVAGGIGITPFVPLVEEMVTNKNAAKNVKLIYGVNKENELLYDNHFIDMETRSGKFDYVKVIAFDDKWKGKKGFVTDVLKEMQLDGYKVYMCGPKPMIDPTLKVLRSLDVKEEDIYYESA